MSLTMHISDAFGYHTCGQIENIISKDFDSNIQSEDKKKVSLINKVKNITTIAGYIPVIGTILAILKLILINKISNRLYVLPKNSFLRVYLTGQAIRSMVELTSLGLLLLIPDLICTIGRNISKKTAEAI